jgi:hypothetical protein
MSPHNEQSSQLLVAAFGDRPEPFFTAARMRARRQSDPGGKVPPLRKPAGSGTTALTVAASIGPPPGMLVRRRASLSALEYQPVERELALLFECRQRAM